MNERGVLNPMMETMFDSDSKRPDIIDMIGPEFDRAPSEPARRTLVICSGPRTGSYELCRYLMAAGIGIPHEYFHPYYARVAAQRWALPERPLEETRLGRYIHELRCRRSQNGVFATKLQFEQFDLFLRNQHGAALFDGAFIIHLFRPDATGQYASVRTAFETGIWDFSRRQTLHPIVRDRTNFDKFLEQALNELNWIIEEDAGFRRLFVFLGIHPLFLTTDELFREPLTVIRRIANVMSMTINEEALAVAIAHSAPYGRDRERENDISRLSESFRKIAFQRRR